MVISGELYKENVYGPHTFHDNPLFLFPLRLRRVDIFDTSTPNLHRDQGEWIKSQTR